MPRIVKFRNELMLKKDADSEARRIANYLRQGFTLNHLHKVMKFSPKRIREVAAAYGIEIPTKRVRV